MRSVQHHMLLFAERDQKHLCVAFQTHDACDSVFSLYLFHFSSSSPWRERIFKLNFMKRKNLISFASHLTVNCWDLVVKIDLFDFLSRKVFAIEPISDLTLTNIGDISKNLLLLSSARRSSFTKRSLNSDQSSNK